MDLSRQLRNIDNCEKTQWQPEQIQSWSAFLAQSLSSWFGTCVGVRKTAQQQPLSRWWPENTKRPMPQESQEPLLDGKPLRMPEHAASSFLRTGTSRNIQEANEII